MDKKQVTAIEYNAGGCDDIGVLYRVKYVCPYCNEITEVHGLYGYENEYDDTVYRQTYARCQLCQKYALVLNPDQ